MQNVCVREAQAVFDLMSHRDVVSWTGVLMVYFTNKGYEHGVSLFSQVSRDGVKADEATWNVVIGGRVENGQIKEAMEMLRKMQNMGFKPNEITISSLLPACFLSGSLGMGKEIHCYIFRHLIIWDLTRTIATCMPNGMHENGKEAFFLFEKMLLSRVKPNYVTFICVLSACSHSRLVDEGVQIFD